MLTFSFLPCTKTCLNDFGNNISYLQVKDYFFTYVDMFITKGKQ